MGDYTAVRDAVASVADLLEEHITLSSDLALAGTPVSTRSPRELEIDKTTAAISVWLHRVDVQPDLINRPRPPTDPEHTQHRPLPVELAVLVTPVHTDGPSQMLLLGRCLQVLADHAMLVGSQLSGSLHGSSDPLRLSIDRPSAYDLSLVWGTLHTHLRPCAELRVAGVVIDTHLADEDTRRVLTSAASMHQIVGVGS